MNSTILLIIVSMLALASTALPGQTKGALENTHYTQLLITADNMSVLVTSLSGCSAIKGDEIAAFSTSGRLVGAGVVGSDGRCGLAVWGDDPTTTEVDGMQPGDIFELRFWDADRTREFVLSSKSIQLGNTLEYETNGFVVLDVETKKPILNNYYIIQNYPNPFNSSTLIFYDIPEASWIQIRVFDIAGREVATLVESQKPAGQHVTIWKGSDLPAGIYLIRMEAANFNTTKKVLLVR